MPRNSQVNANSSVLQEAILRIDTLQASDNLIDTRDAPKEPQPEEDGFREGVSLANVYRRALKKKGNRK